MTKGYRRSWIEPLKISLIEAVSIEVIQFFFWLSVSQTGEQFNHSIVEEDRYGKFLPPRVNTSKNSIISSYSGNRAPTPIANVDASLALTFVMGVIPAWVEILAIPFR